MVQPNSRILMDITKDENSKYTTKFHYEDLKTSFYGFYKRNKDLFFVVLFVLFVIGVHIFRHKLSDLYHSLRNKRYRIKNDLPNILKCKKCIACEQQLEDYYSSKQNIDQRGYDMNRTPSYAAYRSAVNTPVRVKSQRKLQ